MSRTERMHLEAKTRGEAANRLLMNISPGLAEEFRQRLRLTVARFGGRPRTVQDAEWMLKGLLDLVDNFFTGTPLTRTDVERAAAALRAEGWHPGPHWPDEPGGPAIGADAEGKPEVTVDAVLMTIAKHAEYEKRKLADAIEHRDLGVLSALASDAYMYVTLLRELYFTLSLPGEWPERIVEIGNEFEYLRALALELMRRAQKK